MSNRVPWGRLINEALDAGLSPEDALWAVLAVGYRHERGELQLSGRRQPVSNELTAREVEVLAAVATVGVKQAARDLGVVEGTVLEHMKRVRAKFGVRRTEHAIREGVARGLIPAVVAAA